MDERSNESCTETWFLPDRLHQMLVGMKALKKWTEEEARFVKDRTSFIESLDRRSNDTNKEEYLPGESSCKDQHRRECKSMKSQEEQIPSEEFWLKRWPAPCSNQYSGC